jgi:hypothetical protein
MIAPRMRHRQRHPRHHRRTRRLRPTARQRVPSPRLQRCLHPLRRRRPQASPSSPHRQTRRPAQRNGPTSIRPVAGCMATATVGCGFRATRPASIAMASRTLTSTHRPTAGLGTSRLGVRVPTATGSGSVTRGARRAFMARGSRTRAWWFVSAAPAPATTLGTAATAGKSAIVAACNPRRCSQVRCSPHRSRASILSSARR